MRIFIVIFLSFGLVGCATVNFSANYYTPPENYQAEVRTQFNGLISHLNTSHHYDLTIVSKDHLLKNKGIPEIEGDTLRLPENFIKYIYQNYYNDRFTILICVITHEICHTEYNLSDTSTPQAHFQTDLQAIKMLEMWKFPISVTASDYYKSLFVLRNYWVARKGVGGHLFNIGWNVLNAATLAYAGSGTFVDWFATDVDGRMSLLVRQFGIKDYTCFKRSQKDDVGKAELMEKNAQTVLERHPELNDTASEKWQIFQDILNKNPRWRTLPDGPLLTMYEMEKELHKRGDVDGIVQYKKRQRLKQ